MDRNDGLAYEHDGVRFAYPPTVIWEEDERWTYAREPLLRRMPDDSLVCLHYSGGPREPDDDNVELITRSYDDGATWSAPQVLFEHPSRGVYYPHGLMDRERQILYLACDIETRHFLIKIPFGDFLA